jgi:hypothetical protein
VINVDEMDSKLIMQLTTWALSEIVREESKLDADKIQSIINKLNAYCLPLVEEIAGDIVVVATEYDAGTRSLIALYRPFPEGIDLKQLQKIIGYGNVTRFISIIKEKMRKGLVYLKEDKVYLTNKGAVWLQKTIDMELRIDEY